MSSYPRTNLAIFRADRSPLPGIFLMFATLGITIGYIVLSSEIASQLTYLYLVPWLVGLSIVFALPILYLHYRSELQVFNPLVYAFGLSFVPAYIVGGFGIVVGWSEPAIMHFVQDQTFNLPYTIVLIGLGFAALSIGFLSPVGRYLGGRIDKVLPQWEFRPEAYLLPGVVLLLIGAVFVAFATMLGVAGYQVRLNLDFYDSLIGMTAVFMYEATFILMFSLLRRKRFDVIFFAVTGLVAVFALLRSAFAGSRGMLVTFVLLCSLAYFFADPKVTRLRLAVVTLLVGVALITGMVFGTTFRDVKGAESWVSFDQYSQSVLETIDKVGTTGATDNIAFGLETIALRLDHLSTLAVVVSSHEQLAPYEADYGLDNNIMKDLSIFWIPRIIWPDKPSESTPRGYSDLYFNYGESSFVITPIGDLLRNFGPIGVFVGMAVLGLILRIIYRSLIEYQAKVTWRATVFAILLINISYEVFYVSIFSSILKAGFISIIGLIFVYLMARFFGYSRIESKNAAAT